jgi:hypothetical protein
MTGLKGLENTVRTGLENTEIVYRGHLNGLEGTEITGSLKERVRKIKRDKTRGH